MNKYEYYPVFNSQLQLWQVAEKLSSAQSSQYDNKTDTVDSRLEAERVCAVYNAPVFRTQV